MRGIVKMIKDDINCRISIIDEQNRQEYRNVFKKEVDLGGKVLVRHTSVGNIYNIVPKDIPNTMYCDVFFNSIADQHRDLDIEHNRTKIIDMTVEEIIFMNKFITRNAGVSHVVTKELALELILTSELYAEKSSVLQKAVYLYKALEVIAPFKNNNKDTALLMMLYFISNNGFKLKTSKINLVLDGLSEGADLYSYLEENVRALPIVESVPVL